jgi:PAS domain S-box-containing protein
VSLALVPLLVLLLLAGGLTVVLARTRSQSEDLERANRGYAQVFDQAYDALFVLDFVNGKIHRSNQRAAQLLGYNSDELASKTIFDLHFPEDLERSATRIADAWASKGSLYDDIPFKTKSGASLPVECSVKVTSYEDHPAVVIYARDISERLRLQEEVAAKNLIVRKQNDDMHSSLRYASGIQRGILPSMRQLASGFSGAFVINRPKDIVSGDFYWAEQMGHRAVVAVADCTGHGVPGAMLSMTCAGLLRQVVIERGVHEPAAILGELRQELLRALVHHENEERLRDGMCIALLVFDRATGEGEFCGSFHPLYIVRSGSTMVEEIKADRFPVGYQDGDLRPFTPHLFHLATGDRVFMASDGFADQFGGEHGKRFKSTNMKELLLNTSHGSMEEQRIALEQAFDAWKGSEAQVDDVLMIGLQV